MGELENKWPEELCLQFLHAGSEALRSLSIRAFYAWIKATHPPGRHLQVAFDPGSDQEVLAGAGLPMAPPSTWAGIPSQKSKETIIFTLQSCDPAAPWLPHRRHRDRMRTLLQRVYYVPKKLHHSLLHTSVGECSLACICYNEVETSHTASRNPQSSWDMQQCNGSSAGGRGVMTLVLWHTASQRGASRFFVVVFFLKKEERKSQVFKFQ